MATLSRLSYTRCFTSDVWIPSSPDITMSEYDETLPRDVTLHWTIKPNAADDENQVYFTIENKLCEDEVWEYIRQVSKVAYIFTFMTIILKC